MSNSYLNNVDEINGVRFYRDSEDDNGEYEIEIFNPYFNDYEVSTTYQNEYRIMPPGNFPPPPPPGGGGGAGNSSHPPTSPPPPYMPSQNDKGVKSFGGPSSKFVDSGSIRPCLFRFVYIWQTNGRSYWAYLVYIGPRSVAGWRWMGWRWVYFGLNLNKINSFYCM